MWFILVRQFWSAGVMEFWSINQHDKWGKFGLWLHFGIDLAGLHGLKSGGVPEILDY